jgi:hypothetical protein
MSPIFFDKGGGVWKNSGKEKDPRAMKRRLAALALALSLPALSYAQLPTDSPSPSAFSLGGQLSLQSSARFDARFEPFFSLRLIPELKFTLTPSRSSTPGRGVTIDAEASANAFGSALMLPDGPAATSGDVRPYRAWLRLSTSRFEARAGLQKVSFGSATVFRPMMWFDSLDPRDPLQLTEGVYALLLRYYTRGNANFWAWTMVGNEDRRGFDLAPPDQKTPEFGGRVQVPLFKGEIAATYHHRKAAIDGLVPVMDPAPPDSPLPVDPVPEDRFGLDGKWDIGVGVWVEGALVHQRTPLLPLPYQLSLSAGLDYTFAVGRGLHVLGEHFRLESSAGAFAAGESQDLSAFLLRYPFGLADELTAILYYDWKSRDLYRFLSWRRTSDALTFTAMAFWNPTDLFLFPGQPGSSSFAGTGLQLVLAYFF